MTKEANKVKDKIIGAKLNPNERKKITSKKSGKWLSMTDDNGMIGIICTEPEYPERLAYKCINVSFLSKFTIQEILENLQGIYGEDYNKQTVSAYENAFGQDFKGYLKKYNKPETFDK